jgi:uncharacterized cofD-like protein
MIFHDMKENIQHWLQRFTTLLNQSLSWLSPGLGVKRWFVIILAGTTLMGVGLAILILDVYRTAPDTWWLPIISAASLRFIARPLRVLVFGGLGIGVILFGIYEMNRSLMVPFIQPGRKPMVEALKQHRRLERGPRIVALGGGHGLSSLLRGIKHYTANITAIVTVADDGGSSGFLRQELGILPPGDIRNCLAALSSDEALMAQLFQYRFPDGGLGGHSFGNLFISALAEITGSFEEAVVESGRVLAIQGRVLPATLNDVRLLADVRLPHLYGDIRIEGESHIPQSAGKVRHVWLEPSTPPAFPEAIRSILSADLIVIGPGSLYTSILPNLLVPDIAAAIRASRALRVYICNLATQPGETDGYTCGDHIRALVDHGGGGLFDVVVINNHHPEIDRAEVPEGVEWVDAEPDLDDDFMVYRADLVDDTFPWRHDSKKLAQVLLKIFQDQAASGKIGDWAVGGKSHM